MAHSSTLNQVLLSKMARRTRKPVKYIREQVSKRAARLSVTSQAAQVIWAKELGIGTTIVLRRLPPHVQEQVRSSVGAQAPAKVSGTGISGSKKKRAAFPDPLGSAIDHLLTDRELQSRCKDLLQRPRHFDRAVREATTVLENRLKLLAGITSRINPEALVNTTLNPDLAKAELIVSSEPSEQAGVHSICKGIMLTFRHKTHHQLDDRVTREDALRICSFIDVLLAILRKAKRRANP